MGVRQMCSDRKVLLSQELPKSTWLCNLASVFFYILQNFSHLREQKTKYRLSSQIAEVSLGLNIIRGPQSLQNLIQKSEINAVLVNGYSSGFMSWYLCSEWRKVQACSSGFELLRTLNWVYKWTPYWTVRQTSISPWKARCGQWIWVYCLYIWGQML